MTNHIMNSNTNCENIFKNFKQGIKQFLADVQNPLTEVRSKDIQ